MLNVAPLFHQQLLLLFLLLLLIVRLRLLLGQLLRLLRLKELPFLKSLRLELLDQINFGVAFLGGVQLGVVEVFLSILWSPLPELVMIEQRVTKVFFLDRGTLESGRLLLAEIDIKDTVILQHLGTENIVVEVHLAVVMALLPAHNAEHFCSVHKLVPGRHLQNLALLVRVDGAPARAHRTTREVPSARPPMRTVRNFMPHSVTIEAAGCQTLILGVVLQAIETHSLESVVAS